MGARDACGLARRREEGPGSGGSPPDARRPRPGGLPRPRPRAAGPRGGLPLGVVLPEIQIRMDWGSTFPRATGRGRTQRAGANYFHMHGL